jgi:hypothetical protein
MPEATPQGEGSTGFWVRDPLLCNGSRTQSRRAGAPGAARTIRREGATLDRGHFDALVTAVRRRHPDVS